MQLKKTPANLKSAAKANKTQRDASQTNSSVLDQVLKWQEPRRELH